MCKPFRGLFVIRHEQMRVVFRLTRVPFFCALLSLCTHRLWAQNSSPDSIRITCDEADQAFLQRSYVLLAAHYDIDAAQAQVIQARLWNNPSLVVDQGAYDATHKKWFDMSRTGETAASIDELIHIAGQRHKEVEVQKANVALSTAQFYDLVRNLKFQLRTDFAGLFFLRQSVAIYDAELRALSTLVAAFADQADRGNISRLELMRLQSLQFNLQNDRNDLLNEMRDQETELKLLTAQPANVALIPVFDMDSFTEFNAGSLVPEQLLDSAMKNRDDLKAADAQVLLAQADLRLQKSYRIPDLILGANYDRQGSYIRNYNSVSLGFDIPLFNRNQGNIKTAGYRIDQDKYQREEIAARIAGEVYQAYHTLAEVDTLYHSSRQSFTQTYGALLNGISESYRQHAISLLQFIDYYESYKDSGIHFNDLERKRAQAMEAVNLATGTEVIK